MLPHTPGRACAPGGIFSQRSGLNKHRGSISSGPDHRICMNREGIERGLAYLNSWASFPHTRLSVFRVKIGINTPSPSAILIDFLKSVLG